MHSKCSFLHYYRYLRPLAASLFYHFLWVMVMVPYHLGFLQIYCYHQSHKGYLLEDPGTHVARFC